MIRGLVGLDAEEVEKAFTDFVHAFPKLSAQQVQFLSLVKQHITDHGMLRIEDLYEAPFTQLHADGVDGVFSDEAQVTRLIKPWGHNVVLLTKLKQEEQRLAYAQAAVTHGWSRNVLVHHIELQTVERQGLAITNFEKHLPKPQSDLARESLKDPYRFDFLALGREANERELESALVQHITQFLLELGAGFAFVGRQVHLEVGDEERRAD